LLWVATTLEILYQGVTELKRLRTAGLEGHVRADLRHTL